MGMTNFRHDLGDRAVVGTVRREADEAGPIACLLIEDDSAQLGLRVRTAEQADEIAVAAAKLAEQMRADLEEWAELQKEQS